MHRGLPAPLQALLGVWVREGALISFLLPEKQPGLRTTIHMHGQLVKSERPEELLCSPSAQTRSSARALHGDAMGSLCITAAVRLPEVRRRQPNT